MRALRLSNSGWIVRRSLSENEREKKQSQKSARVKEKQRKTSEERRRRVFGARQRKKGEDILRRKNMYTHIHNYICRSD